LKNFRKDFIFLAAVLFLLGFGLASGAAKKTAGVVVIVKAGGSLDGLTLKDIRAIYLGEKLFQGSNKIEPVMNGDESVALVFFEKILGKTKAQYKKIWKSKAFVDALVAPSVLPHSEDVLQAVEKDENVVGFVNDSDLSVKDKKSVKVIFTAE
jgi:ABC-type phosphate transport system substrate-binding protein